MITYSEVLQNPIVPQEYYIVKLTDLIIEDIGYDFPKMQIILQVDPDYRIAVGLLPTFVSRASTILSLHSRQDSYPAGTTFTGQDFHLLELRTFARRTWTITPPPPNALKTNRNSTGSTFGVRKPSIPSPLKTLP